MYKILIIEDDMVIAKSLETCLTQWGYALKYVTDFKDILSQFIQYEPQLVLLDISLPFFNGYHWCGEIRKISNVPIIFISSTSDNMNVVMAINMGADDFIAKPFDISVAVAKVQAMLRRTYSLGVQMNVIEHNGIVLNLSDATVSYHEEKVQLSKNEFKIIEILLANVGKIQSREEIMKLLWESDSFIDDNTLTVNVTRLKKRLEEIHITDLIKTKKGIGYMVE
ncbi:MAG: response regulator transcription factor [Oscillospiraceae bacterium]